MKNFFYFIFILTFLFISCGTQKSKIKNNDNLANNLKTAENNIFSNKSKYFINIDRRYEKVLSKDYFNYMGYYTLRHYGVSNVYMENPKIIVIHSTASYSLISAIKTFEPDILRGRADITNGGEVNVGSHFVVDKDGTIYSVIPIPFIARHTIGLNYTAISIENVGMPDSLTEEQLEANTRLVNFLKSEFNSIEYLIGHYQYNDKNMPHYKLIKHFDKNYKFSIKIDPSPDFIRRLKERVQ